MEESDSRWEITMEAPNSERGIACLLHFESAHNVFKARGRETIKKLTCIPMHNNFYSMHKINGSNNLVWRNNVST